MGDAAAQQQQKRAFFASFPPTGDKSMNVVSDVHHGSVRTVPLGKIENVVRTDTVPLAVLMNRVGCQVAFQVDFSICFGKAVELCFEGGGGGDIPDAMPLLQHDALSNWQQLGAIVYNKLVEADTNASDASEPDDVATGGGQQRQLVVEGEGEDKDELQVEELVSLVPEVSRQEVVQSDLEERIDIAQQEGSEPGRALQGLQQPLVNAAGEANRLYQQLDSLQRTQSQPMIADPTAQLQSQTHTGEKRKGVETVGASESFLDALARSTDSFVSFLARQPGGEAYLGRVYTNETDGLGNMFSNIRYVSPPSPLLSLSHSPRSTSLVWLENCFPLTLRLTLSHSPRSTSRVWLETCFDKDLTGITRTFSITKNTKKAVLASVKASMFTRDGRGQWALTDVGKWVVSELDMSEQSKFFRAFRDAVQRYIVDRRPVADLRKAKGGADEDAAAAADDDDDEDDRGVFGSDGDSDSDSDSDGDGDGENAVSAAPFDIDWGNKTVAFPQRMIETGMGMAYSFPEAQTSRKGTRKGTRKGWRNASSA